MSKKSIFEKYYRKRKFVDRYMETYDDDIDVIIPVLNTNELWENNLVNFYKEIPIRRLFIGDGGCTDETLKIVKEFPRVTVIDHKHFKSQGASIVDLIRNVETEWFIYLHADVFLPDNWFNNMVAKQSIYDWFECRQRITTLIEHEPRDYDKKERAYSGSQMGRRSAFNNIIKEIDDDYLQRNEDIILAELIKKEGYKYGSNLDTFHYHQVMNKRGDKEPKFDMITITKKKDEEWEKRIWTMQAKGIIKYLQPAPYLVKQVNASLFQLQRLNALNWAEFKFWVNTINPVWLKYIKKKGTWKQGIVKLGLKLYRKW